MHKKINNRFPPRGGFYYPNELFFSEAYLSLSLTARNLLHALINELRYTFIKQGRKKVRSYIGNGNIGYPVTQFKKTFGVQSQTYIDARNKLIEVGLIKQTHPGGACRGDYAKYRVLCVPDVGLKDQRWRYYPQKNWIKEVPRHPQNRVGEGTRFKKGQSGRLKATLANHTHKGALVPLELES